MKEESGFGRDRDQLSQQETIELLSLLGTS